MFPPSWFRKIFPLYWRVRTETQDNVTQAIKDDSVKQSDLIQLLTELNDLSPKWLTHSLDKGNIKHGISSERLLQLLHYLVINLNK